MHSHLQQSSGFELRRNPIKLLLFVGSGRPFNTRFLVLMRVFLNGISILSTVLCAHTNHATFGDAAPKLQIFYNKKWYDIITQKSLQRWKIQMEVRCSGFGSDVAPNDLPLDAANDAWHCATFHQWQLGCPWIRPTIQFIKGSRRAGQLYGARAVMESISFEHINRSRLGKRTASVSRFHLWHDINILSSPRPHCTPGARFTKHPTKGARLLLGTINLQSCKIVWDSVRKLAYNISKRIFSIF